jgi:hypothetical protein
MQLNENLLKALFSFYFKLNKSKITIILYEYISFTRHYIVIDMCLDQLTSLHIDFASLVPKI